MKTESCKTVVGLVLLVVQVLTSPLEQQHPRAVMEPQAACEQGQCPDSRFGLDLLSEKSTFSWNYKLRWRGHCGCSTHVSSEDGCAVVTACGVSHRVCLDWRSRRGHWIDGNGSKTCYSIDHEYVCAREKWQAWPSAEVECTW
ncbi:hypothetical protein BB8028_0003g09200 [Beauveria bassiana]|uniref:Uncharacterized protein n=1 Tax=Beauveria bassiana TaxID=176275 RepID=A0A2S7Y8M3_BEABA|nr:hypothetical protein CRV24_007866 [Beauveria bassiana]PQK12303.1 hypothetical protein BB8028_0003g09200 [Beauveria bassiana]